MRGDLPYPTSCFFRFAGLVGAGRFVPMLEPFSFLEERASDTVVSSMP